MDSSAIETGSATARIVRVTEGTVLVELSDGRTMPAPLAWYPRLSHGTRKERNHWRPIANGLGMHWPDLDEDISVENLRGASLPVKARARSNDGSSSDRRANAGKVDRGSSTR